MPGHGGGQTEGKTDQEGKNTNVRGIVDFCCATELDAAQGRRVKKG